MIKRIVEISQRAHLSLRNQQLVIEREEEEPVQVAIEDLGVLILDHYSITHTQQLLSACWQNNVAVILCDGKHLPGAVLLPLDGHSLQSKIVAQQVEVTEPTRKRLWQTIVQAKVREQANVLRSVHGECDPLPAYADKVRSGDPDNIEAQAARIYWRKLFGPSFRRDRDRSGINTLLNYGYAILRAAVARAIVGAGLHPSLGLHHHNQYDSFCLADDLMEPLRPLVDLKVFELDQAANGKEIELDRDTKRTLLETLTWNCLLGEQRLPLMVALHQYAAGVRKVICGEEKFAPIPALL